MSDGFNPGGRGSALAHIPAAWVAVVMLLGVRSLFATWPMMWEYDLPDSVLNLFYVDSLVDIVNLLWGLYLLGLAYGRPDRFPRHFTVWQVANILWLVASEIYVQLVPEFMFSLEAFAIKALLIVVGVFCLWLVRRNPVVRRADAAAARPSPVLGVIAAILGAVFGGALGAVAGFLAGGLIAEAADISCFEGGCGYFAAAIGLLGLLVGAIAGGVFAALRAMRRPAAPASPNAG